MSSPWFALAEVELPVISAAILAGIGWLIRETLKNRREARRQSADLTSRVERLSERIAQNRETFTDLRRDVDLLKREVPQIKENLAVLTAEFGNHEEWHERMRGPRNAI